MPAYCCRPFFALLALAAAAACGAAEPLPTSPDSYLSQAAGIRRANDRPWAPEAGQLGNLRHVQINTPDCVVRVVSGSENRVFPGTRDVVVVEQSRALDTDPNEQPTPRDVVLATDHTHACTSTSCGVSINQVSRAAKAAGTEAVCFTLQIATAHDLLLGGDGLSVLVDRVHQPALRIAINPSGRLRVWFEQVDIGLLSINANAAVRVGGTGRADFLQADSSSRGSVMYLHAFNARQVGVSTTTTGTQWSVRTGAGTKAGYYQPARAPGALAAKYGIEVDGPLDLLEVPASRVDPRPLSDATRAAAQSLRDYVMAQAGPAPELPRSDAALPSATVAAAALPREPKQRVADVVARYLPSSVRITNVALWKGGGRLEGVAPDDATARDVEKRLTKSGEFTYVSGGGGVPRDGGYAFSTQLYFSCDAPGEPSVCPPEFPAGVGVYSEVQVRDTLRKLLGSAVTLRSVSLDDTKIRLEAEAPSEAEVRAGLERIRQETGLFRLSTSGFRPTGDGSPVAFSATLNLTCSVPPKADGICAVQSQLTP